MKNLFSFLISFVLVLSINGQDTKSKVYAPANFSFSDEIVDAIKALESYQNKIYYDNNHNLIFGYGHYIVDKDFKALKDDFGYETINEDGIKQFVPPVNSLSETEKRKIIEQYLRKDLDVVVARMKKNIIVPLPQHKIDALVIYLFWRGPNEENAEVREFYDLINEGEDKAVADFIANRPKKDKTYLPGNKRRNVKTADLYTTGNYPFWN